MRVVDPYSFKINSSCDNVAVSDFLNFDISGKISDGEIREGYIIAVRSTVLRLMRRARVLTPSGFCQADLGSFYKVPELNDDLLK